MKKFYSSVLIQTTDIDVGSEIDLLKCSSDKTRDNEIGAVATFVGSVRNENEGEKILSMFIEHYPGMTEACIQKILMNSYEKWKILTARVVHRIGFLTPGENIVFVGVSSKHRKASFEACEYIMDYLKTQAPFWKREETAIGKRWVEAREQDEIQVKKWGKRT